MIKLPATKNLPRFIIFHDEHIVFNERIVQVPKPGNYDSDTYVMDLGNANHRSWLHSLKNGEALESILLREDHVAFNTIEGTATVLRDIDQKGFIQQLQEEVAAGGDLAARPFKSQAYGANRSRSPYT